MKQYLGSISILGLCLFSLNICSEARDEFSSATGRELMQAVYDRHKQYPYVYEEQSMILVDRRGNKETRRLRFFSRIEKSRLARFLLLFDSPEEVKGVAVLSEVQPNGETSQAIYLPAFGNTMIISGDSNSSTSFLGTDFSVENLIGENLSDYDHRRQRDRMIEGNPYYIVDVYAREEEATARRQPLRRHYIQKDILFIDRTDYFDDLGRLSKRQTHHDLTQVLGEMWRANMLLMENHQEQHKTLIKINRRIFSADYVPVEVFTAEWLYQNSLDSSDLEESEIEPEADEEDEVRAS